MKEKIYTIPVNEAFDRSIAGEGCACPFCNLYHRLEEIEVETILGPAMMEPDIRIRTNETGFCSTHFQMMMHKKRRLQLGLILESHLAQVSKEQKAKGILPCGGEGRRKKLEKLENSCYVCKRIDTSFQKMLFCAALLWGEESEFRSKTEKVPYFCLPHYRRFCEVGQAQLDKKKFAAFSLALNKKETDYLQELNKDISWFCKKFDYRYDDEPWYNSKDAIERTVAFLTGDVHKEKEDQKI